MLSLTQAERKQSQLIIATFVAMMAYLVFFSSTGSSFLSCPIRAVTGLYCFGCGITRSLTAFIHLDFAESIHMHLLGPIFFLGFASITITHCFELFSNRRFEGPVKWVRENQNWFWILFGLAVTAFGIWRLIYHPHGY